MALSSAAPHTGQKAYGGKYCLILIFSPYAVIFAKDGIQRLRYVHFFARSKATNQRKGSLACGYPHENHKHGVVTNSPRFSRASDM
jgi:hypothetical protein